MINKLSGIHAAIAADVSTPDDFLRCRVCGEEWPCTADDFARYLRTGWPTCCGQTMTLDRRAHG